MKNSLNRLALAAALTLVFPACQNTRSTRSSTPSGSPDDRPYNLQKSQFEDPAPPKHRTSPGDADR
jgi:hypothetical protein